MSVVFYHICDYIEWGKKGVVMGVYIIVSEFKVWISNMSVSRQHVRQLAA